MVNLIEEIKKKREFRELLDSVVGRVLSGVDQKLDDKERVKEARILLRKYFGVFLTNRVIKPKDIMDFDAVLLSHKSSAKRDYKKFYEKIQRGLGIDVLGAVIDLGCGVNGFSYSYLRYFFGDINYIGVEASGQIACNTNLFFDKSGLGDVCSCVHADLFDLDLVKNVLKSEESLPRVVFLFQVVDALENLEKDFSKEFLLMLKENSEYVVLSLPTESLGGKKKFEVRRSWILEFLKKNFVVLGEENMFGERFVFLES